MPLSFTEYGQLVSGALDAFQEEKVQIALLTGFDFADAVVERVGEDRIDAEGGIFGTYSEATLKRKRRANRGDDPRINFRDTNQMLNTTRPVIEEVTENFVVARVYPQAPGRETVMGYLEDRYDNQIIEGSAKEQQEIAEDYLERVNEFLDNQLG